VKSKSKTQQDKRLSYREASRLAKIAEDQVAEAIARARAELDSPELVRGRMTIIHCEALPMDRNAPRGELV
jgi:hypothetical protein